MEVVHEAPKDFVRPHVSAYGLRLLMVSSRTGLREEIECIMHE